MADRDLLENLRRQKRQNVVAFSMILFGIGLFVVQYVIGMTLDSLSAVETQKSAALQAEINNSLNSLTVVPQVKQQLFVKQVMFQNYRLSNLLIKVDQTLPSDAWLTKVEIAAATDLKKLTLNITGGTLSADPFE